jgi:hypothetical protein
VEDIFNYLDLARTELKINEMDDLGRVLDKLSSSINPVILGHGYRLREQASFLADNVLSTHLKDVEAKKKIVSTVTKGRFSHDYIFNRKEADEIIKLPIKKEPTIESILEQLFKQYQISLELTKPYNSEEALGSATEANKIFNRAVIESSDLTHVFRTERVLTRKPIQLPGMLIPMPQVFEKVIKEGWVEDPTF